MKMARRSALAYVRMSLHTNRGWRTVRHCIMPCFGVQNSELIQPLSLHHAKEQSELLLTAHCVSGD
jgi:hypothetical protein